MPTLVRSRHERRQQHGQIDRERLRERAFERDGQEEWHRAAAWEHRREERGLPLFSREGETSMGSTGERPASASSAARGD